MNRGIKGLTAQEVRRSFEMHGGKIFAESVEGEYTKFTVLLSKPKK